MINLVHFTGFDCTHFRPSKNEVVYGRCQSNGTAILKSLLFEWIIFLTVIPDGWRRQRVGLDLSNAFFLLCITHDAISPKIINVFRGPLFSHTHNGSLILI